MAGGSAGADLQQLDILFSVGMVGDLSDGQLLRRFLEARDEAARAAFAALVDRHGPMVLRVCRRTVGDPHDAQDAFQATFLVLARKAGSIRKGESVAGWLHGVALRVGGRIKADAARRRDRERRAAGLMAEGPAREGGRPESWPELHEEVARLPGSLREPVVLCYLEGLTTEAAATRIGCPRGTILSRLSRARERLRGRLIRRGLAPPEALFAAGPAREAEAALPALLLKATSRASWEFASGQATGAALASASTLARRTLYAMTISKLKTMGAVALACAFALGGVRTFGQVGGLGGGRDASPPENLRVLAGPTLAGQEPTKEEARGDWDDLKGMWDVVSVEVDGRRLEPTKIGFNECRLYPPRPERKGSDRVGWFIFMLDGRLFEEWPVEALNHEAKPKGLVVQSRAVDLLAEDRQGLAYHGGIFRLEGDTLTVCLARGGLPEPSPRPEKFTAEAGSRQTLIVLHRRRVGMK